MYGILMHNGSGWECDDCGAWNEPSRRVCNNEKCAEQREEAELIRARKIIAGRAYADAHGIKDPPPEQHYDWKDFLPEGDQ